MGRWGSLTVGRGVDLTCRESGSEESVDGLVCETNQLLKEETTRRSFFLTFFFCYTLLSVQRWHFISFLTGWFSCKY